jgi:tetratricopeptide (TPR) repeat protein
MSSSRLDVLMKFLEEDPTDSFTRYAIALEYASMHHLSEAIMKMEELITLDPNYVPAYQQLGGFLKQTGNTGEALKIFERGIQQAALMGDKHALDEMQEAIDELDESDS